MELKLAEKSRVKTIVEISERAFYRIYGGAALRQGSSEYDSLCENEKRRAFVSDQGRWNSGRRSCSGMRKRKNFNVSRIFADSVFLRKGYGLKLMRCTEGVYPQAKNPS